MLLFEITQRITDVWSKWKKDNPRLTDPTVVNNGYCADFALEVAEVMPKVKIWSNFDKGFEHVFVEHGGKFYDAESLGGVADYKQLPIWQRIADLHDTTVERVSAGSKQISLKQLTLQYGFKYPPTK